MKFRCGVDMVYIPGISRILVDENLIKKFFHPKELSNSQPEHLAGVLAAKEAFFKALGKKPKFQDIVVSYELSGRPRIITVPMWDIFISCDLSISHDHDYAIAMVVLEI